MAEIYFCLKLTEAEHDFLSVDLRRICHETDCNLHYYRKLKDGHVPMVREIKVDGSKVALGRFRRQFSDNNYNSYIVRNPHKDE